MPGCGTTICSYCRGNGTVRAATSAEHDCTVCDGTGWAPRIVSHQNNPLSEILRDALRKNES